MMALLASWYSEKDFAPMVTRLWRLELVSIEFSLPVTVSEDCKQTTGHGQGKKDNNNNGDDMTQDSILRVQRHHGSVQNENTAGTVRSLTVWKRSSRCCCTEN